MAMFIVPISDTIPPVKSAFESGGKAVDTEPKTGFTSLFRDIFAEVQESNRIVAEDNVRMAMGEIDDLHTLYNNMTKAQISVEAFVAVKNATVESYERIMQMQI